MCACLCALLRMWVYLYDVKYSFKMYALVFDLLFVRSVLSPKETTSHWYYGFSFYKYTLDKKSEFDTSYHPSPFTDNRYSRMCSWMYVWICMCPFMYWFARSGGCLRALVSVFKCRSVVSFYHFQAKCHPWCSLSSSIIDHYDAIIMIEYLIQIYILYILYFFLQSNI